MQKFNPLSDEDHAILASYFPVADGIAALFGKQCEVVLHSLEFLEQSAIYIVNGHNSERKIGSPISRQTLQSLQNMQTDSVSAPYFAPAENGVMMKSITIAIRNRKQLVIGLLCISVNLDTPTSQFLSAFFPSQMTPHSQPMPDSLESIVAHTIDNTISTIMADRHIANHNKNRHIITTLFEKGIFDIKDAVNQVTEKLNVSRHTVYLYIRQMKQEEKE